MKKIFSNDDKTMVKLDYIYTLYLCLNGKIEHNKIFKYKKFDNCDSSNSKSSNEFEKTNGDLISLNLV